MDNGEQVPVAAAQRMANFRLGASTNPSHFPTSSNGCSQSNTKSHARSHSRTNSTSTIPLKISSLNNASFSFDDFPDVPSSPRSRPNSHHRRRSSVSTRRESAEMMGIVLPPETTPDSTGEPAECRYLALRALEGNGRTGNGFIGSFTKVEIPEFESLESEAPKSKPSFQPFPISNSIATKRDSFGKLLSSNTISDQLHTLLEEEEEEDEEDEVNKTPVRSEHTKAWAATLKSESILDSTSGPESLPEEPSPPSPPAQPYRHRPSNLVLRPLSLTPNTLPLSRVADLPTPSLTPSPRLAGLKALTLGTSPASSISSVSSTSERRQSMSVNPSPRSVMLEHRSSGGYVTPLQRKSSISYKRTDTPEHATHLPTPQATPTTTMPPLHIKLPSIPKSSTEIDSFPDLDRPLSPTEQTFLFRSHTSLLCRISELENAISEGRSRNSVSPAAFGRGPCSPSHERLLSMTSTSSMSETESVSSQPSDELLQLVSDLKSERDELMRDIEGWRMRVNNLDKQTGILTRRVEAERREGWVVRERLGVLEVEKKRVREDLERERLEIRRLEKALSSEETGRINAQKECNSLARLLQEEQAKRLSAEQAARDLRIQLAQLRDCTRLDNPDLHTANVTPRSMVSSRHASNSLDLFNTDMEEYIPLGMQSLKLNSVREEPEDHDLPRSIRSVSECDDESDDDELAHYEEDDLDDEMLFDDEAQTSSSFESVPHINSRLELPPIAPESQSVTPAHARSGSMERGWSFALAQAQSTPPVTESDKVDRFFECLDALDNDTESDSEARSVATYDSDIAKQFWKGAMIQTEEGSDDLPPFILPPQPNLLKKEKPWKEIEAAKLDVVAEEDEDEDDLFNPPLTPTQRMPLGTVKLLGNLQVPAVTALGKTPILQAPPIRKRETVHSTEAVASSVPASEDSYTLASSSNASITPPAKRGSINGATMPSMIPRLSTSPKTPPQPMASLPIITSHTPSRIPTASKSAISSKNRTVFMPGKNVSTPQSRGISQPKIMPRLLKA